MASPHDPPDICPSTETTYKNAVYVLTKTQAEYLGVDIAGPYKADAYRY